MIERTNTLSLFGEWVKKRRKALDLTQNELALRSGCTVFTVRKIESGERRPSKQLAEWLATALEIPPEEKTNFIKVSRGEINLERLDSTLLDRPFDSSMEREPAILLHRIPFQPMPLVGRETEIAAMKRLFTESQCRLLTLTGVGGIGKTRLAIEFATRQHSEFPGGVFYVPLTPINSPNMIVPAIADSLGFVFSGPTETKEQIINYIANQIQQSVLLVLDNIEHLLVRPQVEDTPGVAALVSEFLLRLSNVRILATSRERLNLQGEWTYELHGLPIPSVEYSSKQPDSDAVTLFIQSAQRAKVDFDVTDKDLTAIVQICHLVDGIPLAIELAAAWVGMLSCQEIAQEIDSNIDFLTTSMRDIPERHRSIRASFEHSWNLLSGEEQRVLSQLSVFRGGFNRDAAEQVTGASLQVLASFVSKSLVLKAENDRYDLHEVIRQFTLSHLGDDPSNHETYKKHSEYYLAYTHDGGKRLKSASQQEAVRQLTDEIDNIRAAWIWAIDHNNLSLLGKAVRGLGWYFEITGLYRKGIEQLNLLEQVMRARLQENREWQRVFGMTLSQQGLLFFRKGEFNHARAIYEESVSVLRPTRDQALLADALIFGGTITHLIGDYEKSESLLEEGLACAQAANDQWFEAYAIYNLGYFASLMGRYEVGYKQMLAGLDMWRKIGDPQAITLGLNFLIPTLNKLGRYQEANAMTRESIALSEQSKNRWGEGTAYCYLGVATMGEGKYKEAQSYFRKSLEIFGDYIEGWNIARSLTYLGEALIMSGELSEAKKKYLNALRISMKANSLPIIMDSLVGYANLLTQTGELNFAYELSTYVKNNIASEQETKERAEKLCGKLTEDQKLQTIEVTPQEIATMDIDEIVKSIIESN